MVTKISLQIVLVALSIALFWCVCHGHITLLLKAGLQLIFESASLLPAGKTSRVKNGDLSSKLEKVGTLQM